MEGISMKSKLEISFMIIFIVTSLFIFTASADDVYVGEHSIFVKIGDYGEQRANKLGLTIPVAQTLTLNDTTILFTESLYDGSTIRLAYVIKSAKAHGDLLSRDFFNDIEFSIDGKTLLVNGMGAGGEVLEDGNYAGIIDINFQDKVRDSFLLEVKLRQDGEVMVEIPIQLKGSYKRFPIDERKQWAGNQFIYKDITLYPTVTVIQTETIVDGSNKHLNMDLKVTDENGLILPPLKARSSGEPMENGKIKIMASYYFEPLDMLPIKLVVQPIQRDFNTYNPSTVRENWEGKSFTLSQGEAGTITIQDVTRNQEILTVTYDVTGSQDHQQAATLWVEDIDGNQIPGNYPPRQLSRERFQLTFKVDNDLEEYYIGTAELRPLKYVKQLETTVHLEE